MIELFFRGGVLFMSLLSLMLLMMFGLFIYLIVINKTGKINNLQDFRVKRQWIKELGIGALVLGVLAQMIGLYSAFKALHLGEVLSTTEVVSGGFVVSGITTIYGVFIFVSSRILMVILKRVVLPLPNSNS